MFAPKNASPGSQRRKSAAASRARVSRASLRLLEPNAPPRFAFESRR
jgi:hypothetical protein